MNLVNEIALYIFLTFFFGGGYVLIIISLFYWLTLYYAILFLTAIILFYRIQFPFEFNGFFEIKSIKTCAVINFLKKAEPWKTLEMSPLDPKQQYMFSVYPHGIYAIPWGMFLCHLADINIHPLTFSANISLRIPFLREVCLIFGGVSACWKSLKIVVEKNRSVVIAPGSVREMQLMAMQDKVIRIIKRTSFIKGALQYGFTLVPVIGVGVNNTYKYILMPWEWFNKIFGFYPFLSYGRYGLFYPRRTPIHFIIGNPIRVDKIADPTETDIDELTEKYYEGLREALDFYNKKFSDNYKLEIIDSKNIL